MSQDWAAPWAQRPFQGFVSPCLDCCNPLTAWLFRDGASQVEHTGGKHKGLGLYSDLGEFMQSCKQKRNGRKPGKLCPTQHG